MDVKGFDLIGDIHGHAEPLRRLLACMGYVRNMQGIYAHPERKAIFLGDFIDRLEGGQRAVIDTVRPMVETGTALAVMGNHEFNAIAFYSRHPETGEPLRPHSEGNRHQHQAFLREYEDDPAAWAEVIQWFKTLPLYLELDDFRAVHACWHPPSLALLQGELVADRLCDELMLRASEQGTDTFRAVEILLKGLEVRLPPGVSFSDSYGIERRRIRIKWWLDAPLSYQQCALVPPGVVQHLPDAPVEARHDHKFGYAADKPVFFGHYWFSGTPRIQSEHVACLDYSVARGEKLVAYRWNEGDAVLRNDRFVQVDCQLPPDAPIP